MALPTFTVDLLVPGPPAQVWQRLWDLDRHTAAVPLTVVRRHGGPGPLHAGDGFTARTAVGPLHLDDVMAVRSWEPPRRAVVAKVGRLLTGVIEVELQPSGQDTRLRWVQTYRVARVPDTLAALARPGVRAAYRRTLRRIVGA